MLQNSVCHLSVASPFNVVVDSLNTMRFARFPESLQTIRLNRFDEEFVDLFPHSPPFISKRKIKQGAGLYWAVLR